MQNPEQHSELNTDVLDAVLKNNLYNEISKYIMSNWPGVYNVKNAKELSKFLIVEMGFSKEQILEGQADRTINDYTNMYRIQLNSVRNEGYGKTNEPNVLLKTRKIKVNPKRLTILLGGLVAVSLMASMLFGEIRYADVEKKVSSDIATLAGADSVNIVLANKESIRNGRKDEDIKYYYDNADIALGICNIIKMNPDLIHVCLYNTYSLYGYLEKSDKAMQNMNEVFSSLKVQILTEISNNNEKFIPLQEILNFNSFEDYVDACKIKNGTKTYKNFGKSLYAEYEETLNLLKREHESKGRGM